MVIQERGRTSISLLLKGSSDMDAYIAVTRDEEDNIISCLMASTWGPPRRSRTSRSSTICRFEHHRDRRPVNKKLSAANDPQVHPEGEIVSVATLHGWMPK